MANESSRTSQEAGGVVDATRASLGFAADRRLSGLATCNRMTGEWRVVEGATARSRGVSIGLVGTTRKLCAPALMDQEAKLVAALDDVTRFEIGDTGAVVVFGGLFLIRTLPGRHRLRAALEALMSRAGWAIGIVALVAAVLVPTPWVPLERIETVDGHVLGVDSGYLNVLTEHQEFVILLSADVLSRE